MKKRNRKGFTLVELLAVIVILAIILVIAVPQVMNVIKDTTKASLESSAKMVAAQVENQYTVAKTLGKDFGESGSCMEDWAGLNEIDYASCTYKVDTNGNVKVTIGGKGKFEGLSVCNGTRSSATASEDGCGPKYTKLASIATTSNDLGVTSVHACATSGTCEDGTAFAISVNNTETYKFYVINDTGKEITLIGPVVAQSNSNVNYNKVSWISKEDYNNDIDYDNNLYASKGPLTALRILKDETSEWTNIDPYSYVLENDSPDTGDYGYASFEVEDVRARLPKYSDYAKFMPENGCSYDWPEFLETYELYWLSTANKSTGGVYSMTYDDTDTSNCIQAGEPLGGAWGSIRPVITLSR